MEIQILCAECVCCMQFELQVYRALRELGLKGRVFRVEGESIVNYLVPGSQAPGLMINGELVWAGGPPPSEEKLKSWIWLAFQREQLQKAG
ncbi:MAG: thioredoxin family protein [Armatimonadota bacterium]|nr:thioredoxin family protein [Armatimonadota bacterium]